MQAGMTGKEGFLMNISADILVEILSRLPATDVISCKLVCKRWLKMSSTREFAKLHLSRSNPCLVAFQREYSKEFCRIFKFDDDEIDPNHIYCDPVIEFDLSAFREITENINVSVALVGSVNGLICFCDYHGYHENEILYVCNPVTREYVTLPIVEGVQYSNAQVCGFGVSTISGQYKVVRISHGVFFERTGDLIGFTNSECCVYTLGTGSWRSIDSVPNMYDYQNNAYRDGLFFNGNLHWLIEDLKRSKLISCFDLENELFRSFPCPPGPFPIEPFHIEELRVELYSLCLGIVTGCLCLCDNTSESDIHIWVMKEYGVKNSWTKDYVLRKFPYVRAFSYRKITPLKMFKNGDMLLFINDKFLLTYNNQSKTMQMSDTVENIYFHIPLLHVSSFLSLKDFELERVRMF